jgi:hypothetical protein
LYFNTVNTESNIDSSQGKINRLLATMWTIIRAYKNFKKYDSERKFANECGFNVKGDRNSSLLYSVEIIR